MALINHPKAKIDQHGHNRFPKQENPICLNCGKRANLTTDFVNVDGYFCSDGCYEAYYNC